MPAAVAPLASSIARSRRSRWCRVAGRSGMGGTPWQDGEEGGGTGGTRGRPRDGWSGAGWLALSCQTGFEGLVAGAADDRGLHQGLPGDAELAAARAGAGEQVPRAGRGGELLLGVAPQLQRGVQVAEDGGVDLRELGGHG